LKLGTLAALGAISFLAAFAPSLRFISAQDSEARVMLQASKVQRDEEDQIRVDVVADQVSDLGGFEFVLTFDGRLAEPAERSVELGDFLASSGREPLCDDVTVSADAIRYACVTLGAEPRQGAEGRGTLASVYLRPKNDGGNLSFELSRLELATPPGDLIPAAATPTSLQLGGEGQSWLVPVLVVTAMAATLALTGAFVWRRRRASRPGSIRNTG